MENSHHIKSGIDEFREYCLLQASTWKDEWNEQEFLQFIEVIRKEQLLTDWFSLIYPISRKQLRPAIKFSDDSPNKLRERLAELKADHYLYATVFWESFDVVWLAYQKKQVGDERDLDELIAESLQVNHTESKNGTTIIYRVQKRQPIYPDYIHRQITTKRRETEEEHFFGVDLNDYKGWSAWGDEYLEKFLSEPEDVFPTRIDRRRIAYLHLDPLPADLTRKGLSPTCAGGWKLCLAWGPKYAPILKKACLALSWEPVERKTSESHGDYPGLYWDILASEEHEHKDALSLFFEAISRVHKCEDKTRLGRFIITTFNNLLKTRVDDEIEHKPERAEKGAAPFEDEKSAAEVLLSDFKVDFDIDALFPDELRNYIARNLEELSTTIGDRFGLSASRVRTLKQEVRQVLKDEIEAGYHFGIYIPGPADEIKKVLTLIYRKPHYEYEDLYREKKNKKK